MDFITEKLIIISIFIMIVTLIETLAYSTRISGARVRIIATALSLFSTMAVVSRLSTTIQQPLTAKLIAVAPNVTYIYLKSYPLTMVSAKLMGTVLAQLLFIPAVSYVQWFCKVI